MDVLDLSNPVFSSFAFCIAVLAIKMAVVASLTTMTRIKKQVYSSPEDSACFAEGKIKKERITILDDPDVERARRNHLNDLENILPFFMVGLVYMFCLPTPATAIWHFRAFTISRVFHTLAYQIPLPQPGRFFGYGVGLMVNMSMAAQVLMMTAF